MSDNRKYYYLKLKENYFDDDSIVLLESMQDGVLYSNILLKLYLKSLKHGGRLQLDEDIPYTAQIIATITRQQIGTVERALQIFLKLGLVEVLDSGTFWISETPDNVSRGWDAACNRTVTWVELRDKSSGKEFFYFNTHLDHQGKIAREEGVKLIVTKIRQIAGKKAAVILGGDLNTSIDNPHLKPLTRLMASARDTAAETDQKGTFNGFGSAPDTIILDHLFYRGRMKCRKFVTLDGDYGAPYISDHYPIAMVFTL